MRLAGRAACAALAIIVGAALPGASLASSMPVPSWPLVAPTAATKYPNCKKLNAKYPHGVARKGAKDHVSSGQPVTTFKVNDALYAANKHLDRDKDGVACEKR